MNEGVADSPVLKKPSWPVHLVLALGIILMLAAIIWMGRTAQWVGSSITTEGSVIELIKDQRRSKGRQRTVYRPRVQFADANGQIRVFLSDVGQNPAAFELGDSVRVSYQPASADSKVAAAKIVSFASLWLGSLILASIGVVFAGLGTAMLRAGRRKR
jgi:hypothetical protein